MIIILPVVIVFGIFNLNCYSFKKKSLPTRGGDANELQRYSTYRFPNTCKKNSYWGEAGAARQGRQLRHGLFFQNADTYFVGWKPPLKLNPPCLTYFLNKMAYFFQINWNILSWFIEKIVSSTKNLILSHCAPRSKKNKEIIFLWDILHI